MTTTLPTSGPTSSSTPSSLSRLAPLSGVAFVVLLVVHASIAVGGLPAVDASAEDVVRYVTDKQSEIQVGVYLQGLAMIACLWFYAILFHRLRSAGEAAAGLWLAGLSGAIATVGILAVHISLMTVLALRAEDLGGDVVTFAWILAFLVLGMSSFPSATTMLAAGVLILRSPALPGWLGIAALVGGVLSLAGGVSAASTAETWGVFGFLSFVLSLAWIVATSVALVRSSSE
jgi:hypothetical protein